MQEKHKVTLYLPPDLHRQLKIRSAVDAEPMSAIAQRAIVFYLSHADVVDRVEVAAGRTHQIYNCPECEGSFMLQDEEAVAVVRGSGILSEDLSMSGVTGECSDHEPQGEQELVPC
jgi:hypothetical protein